MTCPECQKTIPDDAAWCPSCGVAFRSPNHGGSMLRIALALFAAVSLAACGSDPEAQPAEPRPVEGVRPPGPDIVVARELCTVTIQPDGSLVCTCVPAAPVTQ